MNRALPLPSVEIGSVSVGGNSYVIYHPVLFAAAITLLPGENGAYSASCLVRRGDQRQLSACWLTTRVDSERPLSALPFARARCGPK